GDAVIPNLTAESYLGFIVAYMLGLAALFQLPLLLYIFDHVRPFPPGALLTSQRFVIAGSVVAAAVITPTPDIINQLIVAGPIILIYQLGAVAVFVRRKIRNRTHHRAVTKQNKQPQRPTVIPHPIASQPQSVIQPSVQQHLQRAVHAVPVPSTVAKQQPVIRKSIDGFSKKPVVRQSLAVPERTVRRTMNDIQRLPTQKKAQIAQPRVRSLDGISVA
ncbi:twin-arginine translocase subunit TatC, partial [Candidatus Saccharibacteria bacterium]|nr:twin-arginine translocase subunit TatC [Candidatus Saccharibacteria bacterium]